MADLSQEFTTGKLIRYTLPVIATMLVGSLYAIIDGLFVSNLVGKAALASVTIVMPVVVILSTLGLMTGAGGSAVVGQLLGAGKTDEACRVFSGIVTFTFAAGAVASVAGIVFMEPVVRLLGADQAMIPLATTYGRIALVSLPMFMLQYVFEIFSGTSGKPGLGLLCSVVAGVTNIGLDALLVWVLKWGIVGAAIATATSEYVAGALMLALFLRGRGGMLRLVRPQLDLRTLGRALFNGLSEMVGTLSMSVVAVVYNLQLMSLLGQDGVSAYAALEYTSMLAGAAMGGFAEGVAPLMSFQHGAGNAEQKHNLFRRGLTVMVCLGVATFLLAQALAWPLAYAFTGYDDGLFALTLHAFRIYAVAFLLMGFTFFASSMFTAVENGAVSAAVAFVHTLICEVGAVLLLPLLLGPEGIWWSITVAELAATVLCAVFIARFGRRYGWLRG